MSARVLQLLLVVLLASFAPSAFAACTWSGANAYCATRPEAYAEMIAFGERLKSEFEAANPGMTGSYCLIPNEPARAVRLVSTSGGRACATTNTNGVGTWATECPNGGVWNDGMQQCQEDCKLKQPFTGGFTPPNGSVRCEGGCDVVYSYNGDGTSTGQATGGMCNTAQAPQQCAQMQGYYWHPNLNACVPVKPEDCDPNVQAKEGVCRPPEQCPEGMVTDANGLCAPKGNECPAGQIKSPEGSCLPGEGQCAAGEARGNDGTCKPDANNDGQADEEDDDPDNDPEKNSFSGGDGCNNPPSCSGDPILCGQARIQWRIECNTRREVNIAGGSCEAVPICTGEKCNAMEYAQLLQQWRTSCAVQKMAAKSGNGTGNSQGDANGNGVPDVMEGGVSEGNGTDPSVGEIDGGSLWSKVDRAGWLGGGSCPGLPPVELNGRTIDVSAKPCEQVALLGQLIVAAAMAAAAYIIGRAATGG